MGNWDSYRDDLDALKIELEKLFEVRNDVMIRRVRIAEEKEQEMMKPTDEVVKLWLSKVQAVETEVDDLIRQISQEIEELHPGGFCFRNLLSMPSSYEFEDKVADKLQAVMNLITEGTSVVADDEARVVTIPKDGGAPVIEDFVAENLPEDVPYVEGTIVGMDSIFTEVRRCLEEEGGEGGGYVGIIGLYGMGGVGKTTLLKQIYQKQNNFAVVIWVSVSKELRLEKIQEKIGMKIGLFDKVWKNKKIEEKASDILEILKEKKFVLLMDELWERVDLTKVGVPFPNPENSSKIVFTTRSLEICRLMEADRQFKINCLADEEAWELFKASVGDETLHSHPEQVVDIARGISKECSGLPLALASIGRALAGNKTPQEWRDVLRALKRRSQSTSSISGSDDQLKKGIYNNLKSSYDHLQNDMFKSCLLYCCLFPRDDKISKGHLIDCWIGEGFLGDRLGAQSQGYHIIDVLLSACLLEEEEDDNYVKMHKWIHDMSLWIATEIEVEKINFFVCTDAGLTKPPEIEKWVNMTRKNGFTNLENAHMCSHLQTLFLNKNKIKMIGGDFFRFMPCLKVLNLSDNPLEELPSEISNLVSLQHLDLSHTAIKSLPNQLGALKKLKCLNLESTLELCAIPPWLISTLSVLHVLRLQGCGFFDQSGEDSVVCEDAQLLIEELFCLKNLSMLSIGLRNSHALQKLLNSNRLQSCIQSLWLHSLQHPKSIVISISYMNQLKTLQISECEYLEELEVDFVGEAQAQGISNFYFLDKVFIESCPNLRDLTWLILAPNLKHLEISQCSELEEIIKVWKLSECPELMRNLTPFLKLQILKLSNLPNLRSIYWCDLLFPDLKDRIITECPKLQISLPPHRFNKDHSKEKITADVPSGPSSFNRKQVDPTGSDDVCGSTISSLSTLKRKWCKGYDGNLGDEQWPFKRFAVPLPSNPSESDNVCGSTITDFPTSSVPFLFLKETKDGEDDTETDHEVHQADMDGFVDYESDADNFESVLSHDDTDPRDTVGRGMDVSQRFTFKKIISVKASASKVICCHFSSDGKLLATGGHDKKAVLWYTDTLKSKTNLKEHSALITDVRFSPSMPLLATSSFDKTVRVWDTDNPGYSLRTFMGHSASVMSLDFHPKKEDLICSCDGDGEIRYWSFNNGSCARVFKGGMAQMRFQPHHGRYLAAAAENVVSILDVETQACSLSLQGHTKPIHSVCWDPSGEYLASVSEDSVRLWTLGSGSEGQCVHELSCNGNKFHSCVFHPTYSSLLVIGCYQTLQLWNMTENKTMTLTAHEGLIAALAVSPVTGLIASASHDKHVMLWK